MRKLLCCMIVYLSFPSISYSDTIKDTMRQHMEYNLRKAGLSPETAHWATWASENKPLSSCAHYADMIDGTMNMPAYVQEEDRQTGTTEATVMGLEKSGLCQKDALLKIKTWSHQ